MLRSFLFVSLICLLCTGCARHHSLSYKQAMNEKLSHYSMYSKRHLLADFKRAKVHYPPRKIALLVFKQSKQLQLYASKRGHWHFIKSFPVLAASGRPGPKLRQGDGQVPEGMYRITSLNPESHYLMSMKLNYPNNFDLKRAHQMHHAHLGGNIFIHGKAKSIGCIAIGDKGIEQLFPLVAVVGIKNVRVIIAPDDLRTRKKAYRHAHSWWLTTLYRKIRHSLSNFPLPGRI